MRLGRIAGGALACGIALSVLTAQAQALDAGAFADRLEQVYLAIGYDFELGETTLEGDTITVRGGKLTLVPPEHDIGSFDFDSEITFSGVEERPDGSYLARSVDIPDIAAGFGDDGEGSFSLADIRIDGFYLPAGDPVPSIGLMQLFEKFSTGAMSFAHAGREVIGVGAVEASGVFMPAFASTGLDSIDSVFAMRDISVDLSPFADEDAEFAAVVDKLGLRHLSGAVEQTFSWDLQDGRMVMEKFLVAFEDQGSFDFRADVSGFTVELLDVIYSLQADMIAASGDDAASAEVEGKIASKALRVLSGILHHSASVRYDDASFAGRLLDFLAGDAGLDRQEFVDQAGSMLAASIAELGVPGLEETAVPPIVEFLSDPRSLEIGVAPAEPLGYLDIFAAVSGGEPLSAIGLTVEANRAD